MRRISALCLLLLCAAAPAAPASPTQESTFQDDKLLVYGTPQEVAETLDTLKGLGVDRIRVSVFWNLVAPAAGSDVRPDFDATDPAAYPPGAWDRYDRVLTEARKRSIAVNFNLTSPAPDWATGTPKRADLDDVYIPNSVEFGLFVAAVGTRYSGSYGLFPRVDYWSLWNEPNQGAWLAPQWVPHPRRSKGSIEAAPALYRALVDQAYGALAATGHAGDTIIVGETAPKGSDDRGESRPMKPRRFLLRLYCLDDNGQHLRGDTAFDQGCPRQPDGSFAAQHPGLFAASGWGHHPYELTLSPTSRSKDPEFFTIANLRDLTTLLRRVFVRHGRPVPGARVRGFPLFLTEFGYQTDPPDPIGVSLDQQAAYLNQSEYLAWRNRDVRTLTQFLLVDDKPRGTGSAVARFGATFQSGLETVGRKAKPAFAAYRLPIHLTRTRVRRGRSLPVWGLVRPGRAGLREPVRVEFRATGARRFARLKQVSAEPVRGYVRTTARIRRSGALRLSWTDPAGTVRVSRAVAVTAVG